MLHTVFGSPTELAIACAVFVLAYTVYTLFGFGSGLISVGLLALVLPVKDVAILVLLVNFPVELFILARARGQIPWKSIGLVFSGVAVCTPIGAYLLTTAAPEFLLLILGAVLIAAGLAFLVVRRSAIIPRLPWLEPFVGGASGILGGLFGTAGPPVVLYYQAAGFDKVQFRFALLAIFHGIGWLRAASYAYGGMLTADRAVSALVLVPAMLLGAFMGSRMHVKVSDAAFRQMVSVVLIVIGGLLVFGN